MKGCLFLLAAALAACSPAPQAVPEAAAPAEAAAPFGLSIPAGVYKMDPLHASLVWTVPHNGLSHYTARFAKFDAKLVLDPSDMTKSSVEVTIDPMSVQTAYPGDYKATQATRGFESWDEEVSKSERFLNAAAFPQISFRSTSIELTGDRSGKVSGELSLLGITKAVVLDVTLNGEKASHPFKKVPAVGFRAQGGFKRSDFGMKVSGAVGDDMTVVFDGEFYRDDPAAPALATEQ